MHSSVSWKESARQNVEVELIKIGVVPTALDESKKRQIKFLWDFFMH